MNNKTEKKIQAIISRAREMGCPFAYDGTLYYALHLIHANYSLDLDAFKKGSDLDFVHDVTGIMIHLNPVTGILQDLWEPRFLKRK